MKVFITGATGFIGLQLIEILSKTDHELICLVRKSSRVETLRKQGIELVVGDVIDKSSFVDAMQSCDCVIHLANLYEFWVPDKRAYRDINITGTENVMIGALEAGVSKVVHVSSIVVYGKPATAPITEETSVGPRQFSEYARTKYQGDLIAWKLHARGLPLVVVYPAAVLGSNDPKTTGRYIQNLMQRRLPATVCDEVVFPWVYVKDVAEIIVRAMEKKDNIGEKYLASGENLTFREINRMISEIAEVPLPKFHFPGFLALLNARILTALAEVTKRPPLWGMAADQIRTMKEGGQVDGSKAARALGITYTPIRTAIEGAVKSFQHGGFMN